MKKSNYLIKSKKGFSLLEIMVSISILLIAALGMTSLYTFLYKQQASSSGNIKLNTLADSLISGLISNANLIYPNAGFMYFWCMNEDGSAMIANKSNYIGILGTSLNSNASMVNSVACSIHLCPANSIAVQLANVNFSGNDTTYNPPFHMNDKSVLYVDRINANNKLEDSVFQFIPITTNYAQGAFSGVIEGVPVQYQSFIQYQSLNCPSL